jgi:hypothetical protein
MVALWRSGTFGRRLLKGDFMPIRKYASGGTFGPETIRDMTTALERIRIILKLENPDDPLVEVVAKKVISLASEGIFDPKEIERLVIADTKRPPNS